MTVVLRQVVVSERGALGQFALAIAMRLSQGWMNAPSRNLGLRPRGFSPGNVLPLRVTAYGPI